MCDSPHDPVEDPLLEEHRTVEAEIQNLAAVLLRAIRRRDLLTRLVELERRLP